MSKQSTEVTSEIVPIPETNVPDPAITPDYWPPINNLAADEELMKKVGAWMQTQFSRLDSQSQRHKMCGTDGVLDVADRMIRMALRRDETSDQYADTDSNVTSGTFFKEMVVRSAMQSAYIFNDKELPAIHEPEANTEEYNEQDGKEIADQSNFLEIHLQDEDKRVQKVKDLIWWTNVNGFQVVSCEWALETVKTLERQPTKWDKSVTPNIPTAYGFKNVERTVYEGPTLRLIDPKDFWGDASIKDVQDQPITFEHLQTPYHKLFHIPGLLNLDKVKTVHQYTGEPSQDDTLQERMTNADEDATPEENGMLRVWNVWARMPIKTTKSKSGKGRWSPSDTPTKLFKMIWIGQMNGAKVCVYCVEDPYRDNQNPHNIVYSHKDNKGMYHMGWAQMLVALYWQDVTNMNWAFDNVKERNRAPYVVDGPVHTRVHTFRRNKEIRVAKGTTLTPMEVPRTTEITMDMRNAIIEECHQVVGTDKPLMAQALGQRTSAREASLVHEQAQLPMDEGAQYIADQVFPWLFGRDLRLMRNFSDPTTVLAITHNNMLKAVEPAKLWGPTKIRVVSVDRFRNTVIKRQEFNAFLNSASFQFFVKVAGNKGLAHFWRTAFKWFGWREMLPAVPYDRDSDALRIARQENYNMLSNGKWDQPMEGENDEAHLAQHDPIIAQVRLLPKEDPQAKFLNVLEAHAQLHRDRVAQNEQSAQNFIKNVSEQANPQLLGAGGAEMEEGLAGRAANV